MAKTACSTAAASNSAVKLRITAELLADAAAVGNAGGMKESTRTENKDRCPLVTVIACKHAKWLNAASIIMEYGD